MVDAFLGTSSGVHRLHDGAVEPLGLVSAVCSGGRLLCAAPDDWSWSSAADAGVKAVAFP